MKFPNSIAMVTVVLESGQRCSFSQEDLKAVNAFATTAQFWPLIAFITGMGPVPVEPEK